MSRIDNLIRSRCANGVEYVELGSVVRIRNGRDYKALGAGSVPVYGSGGVMTTVDTAVHDGPSVLIPRKGSLGNLFYVEEPFWTVDTIFYTEINEARLLPKFFYYVMFTQRLAEKNQAGGVPSMTQSYLNRLRIPVPPLEIQCEIVRVLDKFTQLEAELEAELEARRTQYEYYRNALVRKGLFSGGEWVDLASIADIRTGTKPTSVFAAGAVAYINAGNEPSGFTERSNAPGGVITIPSRGQGGAGHVGFQADAFWCGPLCYRVESKTDFVSTRFLYYYLRNIQDDLIALRKIGSIPAVNKSDLGRVLIPIVPRDEQDRVVDLLDRFDTLVKDISIGLPAELAARRKQYEYYRDRLLTFKELAA